MRIVTFNDAMIEIDSGSSFHGAKKASARLISGQWPDNKDLITLCDGDDPANPRHFGGWVMTVSYNVKEVTVYVD